MNSRKAVLNQETSDESRSGWNLYWVASDGLEDCFVVARNSRSAKRVECDMCGFDPSNLTVDRVASIPVSLERSFRRRRNNTKSSTWLGYANEWLLKRLGAEFRDTDDGYETLIRDTVYTNGFDRWVSPRPIGDKPIQELRTDPLIARYGEEDRYSPSYVELLTMLGICVARCQEIEYLIAHFFVFAISPKEKRKYKTINDRITGWTQKTLGQLLGIIEDSYEIEPIVHASLKLFLNMRNELVHGLTRLPRYDIQTLWGQKEMAAFFALFEILSRPIRKAFRSSFYTSVDIATQYLSKEPPKKPVLTRKQDREIDIFIAFFKPKADSAGN